MQRRRCLGCLAALGAALSACAGLGRQTAPWPAGNWPPLAGACCLWREGRLLLRPELAATGDALVHYGNWHLHLGREVGALVSAEQMAEPLAAAQAAGLFRRVAQQQGWRLHRHQALLAGYLATCLPQGWALAPDRNTGEWLRTDPVWVAYGRDGSVAALLMRNYQQIALIGPRTTAYVHLYFGTPLARQLDAYISRRDWSATDLGPLV